MNPKKELAKNTFLIALSKISTQLLVFLMLPIYTTLLSVEQYGFVDLVISYSGIIAPIVLLNLQTALFRYLIDARNDKKAQNSILTNAFEVIVFMTLAVVGLLLILNIFIDIPSVGVVLFYLLSILFSDLVIQITRGVGSTKAFAITSICQGVLGVVFILLLLGVLHMGPEGMLLGLGFGFLLPSIVLSFYIGLHKNIKLSTRDRAVKKELLSYSMPMIPNSIAWWVYNVSDRTIITIVLGVAASGIYAVSVKFSGILGALSGIFYQSWSESASINIKTAPEIRTKFFSDIFSLSFRVFGTLSILILAGVAVFFPWLVNDNFSESYLYIPVLIIGGLLSTIVSYYSAIYLALKKTKQVMNTSIAGAVVNLVINLGLIWFIGIWAAAISTAVAYGVMAIYRYNDMKKYINIQYDKGILVKIIVSFIFVSVLYYINNFWLNLVNVGLSLSLALIMNRSLVVSSIGNLRKRIGF